MRHRRNHKRLHRSKSVNEAALRGLSTAILLHGRIETTLEKAKEARRQIDRLITLGKTGTLQARRRALRIIGTEPPIRILFNEWAPLFKKRQGGYTRVVRSWTRQGDGAQLAVLELTEQRPLPKKLLKPKEKEKASATDVKKEAKPKEPKAAPSETRLALEAPAPEKPRAEKQKPSGFLGSLRKFLKPKDRSS